MNTCNSDVRLSTPDMQPLPASIQQPSKCGKIQCEMTKASAAQPTKAQTIHLQ